MTENFIAFSICVLLPIAVVLITALTKINRDNRRAQLLMKAIETNNALNVEKLAEDLQTPRRSAAEILRLRLLRGCIFSLIGIAVLIFCAISTLAGWVSNSEQIEFYCLAGGLSLAIGASYLIVYYVTRKEIRNKSEE